MKHFFRKYFLQTEILSKDGVLHFQRWRLLSLPWFAIYIHFIHRSDKDKHLHSHPWDFLSFVLKGGYWEENQGSDKPKSVDRFQWNYHEAHDFHRLTLKDVSSPTVSLFFTFGKRKIWGYSTPEGFVESERYRKLKNEGYWELTK